MSSNPTSLEDPVLTPENTKASNGLPAKKKGSKKVYVIAGVAGAVLLIIACTSAVFLGINSTIQNAKEKAKNADASFQSYSKSVDDALSHFEETPKNDKGSLERYTQNGRAILNENKKSRERLESAINDLSAGAYKDSLKAYIVESKRAISLEEANIDSGEKSNYAIGDFYDVQSEVGILNQTIYSNPEKYVSELENNVIPKIEKTIAVFDNLKLSEPDLQEMVDMNVKIMKETLTYLKVSSAAVKERNNIKLSNAVSDYLRNYKALSEESSAKNDSLKEKVKNIKRSLSDLKDQVGREFEKVK